jgi:hypothetical protein
VATALAETSTIPQGNHTLYQGTLTMSERGYQRSVLRLPRVPWRWSACSQPIMKVLRYDAMCDIDCLVHQQFNKTALRAAATATGDNVTLTTNSTATLTVSKNYSWTNHKSLVDTMKGRNIPFYTERDYAAIARPAALRGIKNDLEPVHQYTETGIRT